MPNDYTDINGIHRRPGSLILPPGFVSAMPPFEGQDDYPKWTDADIRKVISDADYVSVEELMPSKDWVKDQRNTSACNGYAAASAYDAARYIRGERDDFRASGPALYALINQGVDRGSHLESGMIAGMEHGFAPQSMVRWDMIFTRLIPQAAYVEASQHKGFESYRVMTLLGLRTALAARYQVIAAVHCGKVWDKRTNGVQGVQSGPGNHAVHIRSIKIDGKRFRYGILNSWGDDFGDNGSTDLIDGHFTGTLPNHAFYAIPSTQEGS